MRYSKVAIALAAGLWLFSGSSALAQPKSISVDFNDPDADVLDQIVTFGVAEVREDGGFGNSGYLSVTDALNGQRGAIAFPALTDGAGAESFRISARLRVGAGTDRPADGFSFNYIRPDDPLIVDILDPDTGELDPDGSTGAYASSPVGEGNLPEEGSQTGIGIGFDEWQSGGADGEQNFTATGIQGGGTFDGVPTCGPSDSLAASIEAGRDVIEHDCIGLSIRIDNELVAQAPFPVLNGTLDNLQSLQTGDARGNNFEELGWAELSIGVVPDITDPAFSNITISYKDIEVFNERVEYAPGPGFLFFGGRTGGANAAHHIDDISIVTNFTQIELPGDFNEDGAIDLADFLLMVGNMNTKDKAYEDGDFDFSGSITIADFVGFRRAFSDFANAGAGEAAAVPEPATGLMVAFGMLGLAGFRRRRR